jgi:hypothetical protein
MLIQETLISPRGKLVAVRREITGTLGEHIIALDREGWKIVKIQVLEGGGDSGTRRQDPGGDGAIS